MITHSRRYVISLRRNVLLPLCWQTDEDVSRGDGLPGEELFSAGSTAVLSAASSLPSTMMLTPELLIGLGFGVEWTAAAVVVSDAAVGSTSPTFRLEGRLIDSSRITSNTRRTSF